MRENTKKEIGASLNSIGDSLNKLNELELSYKEQKEQITTELASRVREIAALSDSQAIRAEVIRDLYWNKKLSAKLISEAFGLKVSGMKRIAGSLVIKLPCANDCGNTVSKSFSSRTRLEDHFRDERKSAGRTFAFHTLCDDCEKRRKNESDAAAIRRKRAILKRNEELRSMDWEDFSETEEWMSIKSRLVHNIGYQCEICHDSGVSLYVYLHKETPQDYPSYYISREGYNYSVLCKKCVPRCTDLINEEKGEYIKKEHFSEIMNWYNSH
jgi:hypothetical protein